MPTFRISAELNFVDSEERDLPVNRHGFDGAGKPPCIWWNDFFLARDQRNAPYALACNQPLVIFTRQQSERKADDAGRVGQHPLDGEVRFASVGRPENGVKMVVCLAMGFAMEGMAGRSGERTIGSRRSTGGERAKRKRVGREPCHTGHGPMARREMQGKVVMMGNVASVPVRGQPAALPPDAAARP